MTSRRTPVPAVSVLGDIRFMLWRNLLHTLRSPDTMFTSIVLPLMLLLMFVYVLGGAMNTGTSYINYVVPGTIILCAAFGAGNTAVAVSTDMQEGIVDRFRTMPLAQSSFLIGHVLAALIRNLVATAVVLTVAIAMGFRPTPTALGALEALGLLALVIVAIGSLACGLGILARSPEAASGFALIILFIPYVSSAFVPTATMPTWMHGFAQNQPMTPIIETLRSLLAGNSAGESAVLATVWSIGICIAGSAFAALVYRQRVLSTR